MKRNRIYGVVAILAFVTSLFTACEKDLPVYRNEECWLRFRYENSKDTLTNTSFAYHDMPTDTVWVPVQLMGFPSEQDRVIPLKQVKTGDNDAVSGEHYVPFDNPELIQKFYFMPKGETQRDIPVVLKRTPSLENADYTLRLTIGDNEFFSPGSKESLYKRIVVSGQLVRPNNWYDYFLGEWGKEKHRFMIRTTGLKWDNDYFDNTWTYYVNYDQNYCFYMAGVLYEALAEYEAEHGKLYEADGTPVEFVNFN